MKGKEKGRSALSVTNRDDRFRCASRIGRSHNLGERHEIWPDVMKIDVEGYECEVVRGARRCLRTCRVVGIELHLDLMARFGGSADIIYTLMAEQGFRECARIASRRHGSNDPTHVHVLFERMQPA